MSLPVGLTLKVICKEQTGRATGISVQQLCLIGLVDLFFFILHNYMTIKGETQWCSDYHCYLTAIRL